jgi:hypothetical protein
MTRPWAFALLQVFGKKYITALKKKIVFFLLACDEIFEMMIKTSINILE